MKSIQIIILIAVLLVACAGEDITEVGLGATEIEEQAIKAFKTKGVWYKKLSDGRFEFRAADIESVKQIVGNIKEQIIPQGHSVNYGPEMEAIMLKKLSDANVPYEIRDFKGLKWVVWQPKHDEAIKQLEKEAKEELVANLTGSVK